MWMFKLRNESIPISDPKRFEKNKVTSQQQQRKTHQQKTPRFVLHQLMSKQLRALKNNVMFIKSVATVLRQKIIIFKFSEGLGR